MIIFSLQTSTGATAIIPLSEMVPLPHILNETHLAVKMTGMSNLKSIRSSDLGAGFSTVLQFRKNQIHSMKANKSSFSKDFL